MSALLAGLLVIAMLPLPIAVSPLRGSGAPSLIAGAVPPATPLLAPLPAVVRVNVAGLGTSYATIGSTGTVRVTRADGTVLYRGPLRTLVRRNVRRVEGQPVPERGRVLPPDERAELLQQLREARLAARETGSRVVVTVPFEVAVLAGALDDLGAPLLSAGEILPLRFTTDDGFLTFDGRAFEGTLEIAQDDEGDMIVVNTVATAKYIASVVGAEIPATWEPEALAAQAIAARTYLATHLRRHRAYDIEGDTRDQAYDGTTSTTPASTRAAERTAGVIATYRGAAIDALYSANAGGRTEDSENVYANALPYLRGVPSPGDEAAKASSWGATSWQWTRELTVPQLRDYLAVRGVVVGVPQQILILERSAAQRVMRARIIGTAGSRDIGKDTSRYYFGLRSSLFDVELRRGGGLEAVDHLNATRLRDVGSLGADRLGAVLRDDGGELRQVGEVYRLPDRYVFSGKGFGHGVGLSQWGAQGMALAGASAEQILTHYYRGIELTSIGGD